MANGLNFSRRLRRTPYTASAEAAGVRGFSVVNHMLLPKAYTQSIEEDYWHLREHVQVWDVSCQRQVELRGPDAAQLLQWMTPRNIQLTKIGQCLYLPITAADGGIINDPVMLKLAEDHFWLSIADSDLRLWAEGLAVAKNLDVHISEPDVSPLAVQGPKSEQLMAQLFGDAIRDLGFFKFGWFDFQGTQQLIARSGYSRQGGFEIYLNDSALGTALWNAVWDAGKPHNIKPGSPNLIERIEGGLFSYGNEMTRDNNPLEIGLAKYCTLDGSHDFIGSLALREIAKNGVRQQIKGIRFGTSPCTTCAQPWPVYQEDDEIGQITSAAWSPRLLCNVGLGMIKVATHMQSPVVNIKTTHGIYYEGELSPLPFS